MCPYPQPCTQPPDTLLIQGLPPPLKMPIAHHFCTCLLHFLIVHQNMGNLQLTHPCLLPPPLMPLTCSRTVGARPATNMVSSLGAAAPPPLEGPPRPGGDLGFCKERHNSRVQKEKKALVCSGAASLKPGPARSRAKRVGEAKLVFVLGEIEVRWNREEHTRRSSLCAVGITSGKTYRDHAEKRNRG